MVYDNTTVEDYLEDLRKSTEVKPKKQTFAEKLRNVVGNWRERHLEPIVVTAEQDMIEDEPEIDYEDRNRTISDLVKYIHVLKVKRVKESRMRSEQEECNKRNRMI